MRLPLFAITASILSSLVVGAATTSPKDGKKEPEEDILKPCTMRSPNTGSFFDLNPLHITLPDQDSKLGKSDTKVESWHARGYDYGANFTINFCGPVVEKLENVEGLQKSQWQNVSAYYKMNGKTYSIGQQKDQMIIRGKKLVLNYTDGSPCPAHATKRALNSEDLTSRSLAIAPGSGKKAANINVRPNNAGSPQRSAQSDIVAQVSDRRKSSIFSLLCERDPLAAKASVSFVGASADECTYFFELRSSAACPAVNVEKQQVGPSAVFGLIAAIAFLVYLIGGIAYQRAVLHQRGWRQLPNYAFWAGIFGFVTDMVVISFYSIITCCRRRRSKGYNQVDVPNGHSPRRGPVEDENRVLDQLDEEWDD